MLHLDSQLSLWAIAPRTHWFDVFNETMVLYDKVQKVKKVIKIASKAARSNLCVCKFGGVGRTYCCRSLHRRRNSPRWRFFFASRFSRTFPPPPPPAWRIVGPVAPPTGVDCAPSSALPHRTVHCCLTRWRRHSLSTGIWIERRATRSVPPGSRGRVGRGG